MASKHNKAEDLASGFWLSRHDWIYILSLLIPFAVYNLVLKGLSVLARSDVHGLAESFPLVKSDLLFICGYVLLWIALFGVVRHRPLRWIITALFHVVTIFIALFTTAAYRYLTATGTPLDSHYLLFWISSPEATDGPIKSELTTSMIVLIVAIAVYGIFCPAVIAGLAGRAHRRTTAYVSHVGSSWRHCSYAVGVGLIASVLFVLAPLPGGDTSGAGKSFARHAFVHLMVTAHEATQREEIPEVVADPTPEYGPINTPIPEARLVPTPSSEQRNVVLIFLESTRASATTPYNQELHTTPFMARLAEKSILIEKAYAIIAHTHNALMASNCGTEPPLEPWGTAQLSVPGSIPPTCLPHLLKAQGYNTVYFMSHIKSYENSEGILKNLGYEDFYSIENMSTEGFEPTYYWGYEDEMMLEPSREWHEQHPDKPFLAAYLTSAPHHDYLAPSKRYGRIEFTKYDVLNRYLNAVRNQDFFLRKLFEQYKQLGLYENTIFVILGDHGEGFGEHGRYGHDNMIYEEGMRIPMMIHDPRRAKDAMRIEGPANQLDILPTVVDMLGYQLQGGIYGGSSLLQPLPPDRTLMFSCWGEKGCLASLKGTEKYIYHFDDKPDELFDLATDPDERKNLARLRSAEELNKRRSELLRWRAKLRTKYAAQPSR